MNIRQMEALLEAMEMAYDALMLPLSSDEKDAAKNLLKLRIAQIQLELRTEKGKEK